MTLPAPATRRALAVGAALAVLWLLVVIPCLLLNLMPFASEAANWLLMLATLLALAVGAPLLGKPAYRSRKTALTLAGGALLAALPVLAILVFLIVCSMFSC